MPIINRIAEFHAEMTRVAARHPRPSRDRVRGASNGRYRRRAPAIVRPRVDRGIAGTGVIGTFKGSAGERAIGLRADMDALHIDEQNGFAHASQHRGHMHACGHDGHTAMLLGAAKYLAETRNFAGTVHFIFQPAEENEGGARVMIEEGMLDKLSG